MIFLHQILTISTNNYLFITGAYIYFYKMVRGGKNQLNYLLWSTLIMVQKGKIVNDFNENSVKSSNVYQMLPPRTDNSVYSPWLWLYIQNISYLTLIAVWILQLRWITTGGTVKGC